MTSFLSKKKNNQSYEEKLTTVPEHTRRNKLYAIKIFEDFVCEKYNNRTISDIIEELQAIKKTQEQEAYEEALYGMLQDWINWNESREWERFQEYLITHDEIPSCYDMDKMYKITKEISNRKN